jgi:hypothetical protein
MKKSLYCLIILILFANIWVMANPTISFFFKPYHSPEKIVESLKRPDVIATHSFHSIIEQTPIAGIFATYAGYITVSDYSGEVIFPRKHQKAGVEIIVTTAIMPVSLFENTIDHWNLVPNVPATMYSCEEKYDENTKTYYWETQELPLPTNRKIPLSAIVIIARPRNIIIPSEKVTTLKTANLTLPPIYVEKGINIVLNSTYILHIRHLFRAVESQQKREPIRITTHILD